MLRHLVSVLTVVSLLVTSFLSEVASAATKAEKEAKRVEKIKAKVRKVGTGEQSRVTVGLEDSKDPGKIKELRGYVSKIDEDSFVVTNLKTKETTTVAYRNVAYVHGKGLPLVATVGIVAGVAVGVLLVVYVVVYHAGND